ncbi:MAG: phosphate acyltransferase PlsX, partial [Acidimicrobiales bacterium]
MARDRERPSAEALATLPVALDAMGGDQAPHEIVAGARRAADDGVPVVLVGPPELVGDTMGLDLVPCTEVIEMAEDPASGVRRKKDSSLVRVAELVRDSKASAMVSAGNTGATMASALLRMGRLPKVSRPCIATPMPRPGRAPAVLVDSGANVECTPAMLVQFAQMASVFARERYGISSPRTALLSIGEEASKGTPLVKDTHGLLAAGVPGVDFAGNVEGRDLLDCPADVVVADGFTGNVALKTAEGALRFAMALVLEVLGTDDETTAAGQVLLPHLLDAAAELNPETTGGAMLLGVDGVCVISHGSSTAVAVANALHVAHDLAKA